jgi:hypothetical protein
MAARGLVSWALLLGCIGLNGSVFAADPVQLKYKFAVGQSVHYEVTSDGDITTQVAEVSETTKNKSRSKKHFRVLSVTPEGEGDLEMTIDWVRLEAQFGDEKSVVYQSDDPELRPSQFKDVDAVVGKAQAVIRFSALGKLVGRQGGDAKANAAAANPTESYLIPLPEQPVAVGDTWKERFEVEVLTQDKLPLRVKMLRSFKLAEVAEGKAKIDFRTSILTPIEDPALSAQLIQRETAGQVLFDIETGTILSRNSSLDRTVVNPFGPKTSLRATAKYLETAQTGGTVAANPGATSTK